MDRSASSTYPEAAKGRWVAPLDDVDVTERLDLRVLLDQSVLEVFAGRRRVLTVRIHPARADSLGLGGFADGGAAELSLDAWSLDGRAPD